MNINDQLESDIVNFFTQIENQNKSDKKETLRNLLNKYAHINSSECILSHYDLQVIISQAKDYMVYQSVPVVIGEGYGRQVDSMNLANLAVIEATIGYFNNLNCFKRLPKFDYKK